MTEKTPSPRREPLVDHTPVRPRRGAGPLVADGTAGCAAGGAAPGAAGGAEHETPLKLVRKQSGLAAEGEAPPPAGAEKPRGAGCAQEHRASAGAGAAAPQDGLVAPPPGLAEPAGAAPAQPAPAPRAQGASAGAAAEPAPEPEGSAPCQGAARNQTRNERIMQLLCEALSSQESAKWEDREGYVPMSKLLRARPDLQHETFGSTRIITHAVESRAAHALRLDKSRRRIRLQTPGELVRSEAAARVAEAAQSSVPLRSLLEAASLQRVLAPLEDPAAFVREALEHEESEVVLRDAWVVRCPRWAQLRRAAEELFSDSHLAEDSRLRSKTADSPGGEVPLTWLCGRYAERLGTAPAAGARAVEVSAAELGEALAGSGALAVDLRRLTVHRRTPYQATGAAQGGAPGAGGGAAEHAPAPAGGAAPAKEPEQQGAGASRAAAQLRQLLDFYFEPFTIQNNRYLLDLLMRSVGPPEEAGPWVAESLAGFSCTISDLTGLGRIASVVAKLKAPATPELWGPTGEAGLKHLSAGVDGRLRLCGSLEVRNFVPAVGVAPEQCAAVVQSLTAAREQRSQAPPNTVSVVSYALHSVMTDDTQQGQQRQARVKRQLLVHRADIVCLQGLDPEGSGASLAGTLSQEGYGFTFARGCGGEANAIFWDRSRWEKTGSREKGAAVAADLRAFDQPGARLRAVCLRPGLAAGRGAGLRDLFGGAPFGRLLVCADLWLLGGAEAAAVVEELAGLPSAAQEVLGEELAAPAEAAVGAPGGGAPALARSAASGLNKLQRPDAVLYRGMAPITVLSGHTEGYLATMAPEEVLQQFPAFRTPLVAAFDLSAPPRAAGAAGPEPPSQNVRL